MSTVGGGVQLNVNFIRDKRQVVDARMKKDRSIAKYTSFVLIGFLLIVIGVVVATVVMGQMQKTVQQQTDAVQQELQSMTSLESEYIVFVKKVKLLYELDLQKKVKRDATAFFYGLLPKDAVLMDANIDEKKNRIAFQIKTTNVFRATELTTLLYAEEVKKRGYDLLITAVDRKSGGSYVISGSLGFAVKK